MNDRKMKNYAYRVYACGTQGNLENLCPIRPICPLSHLIAAHPRRDSLAHALLEGKAEGAVAAVAAIVGQLLGNDRLLGSSGLVEEVNEMVDTQIVDIGIVGGVLTREILAEVETVGANGLSQLGDGQVVLKVKLRGDAVLLQ